MTIQNDMIGPAFHRSAHIINAGAVRAVSEALQIGHGDFCASIPVEREAGITVHFHSGVKHQVIFSADDPRKGGFRFLHQRNLSWHQVNSGN